MVQSDVEGDVTFALLRRVCGEVSIMFSDLADPGRTRARVETREADEFTTHAVLETLKGDLVLFK